MYGLRGPLTVLLTCFQLAVQFGHDVGSFIISQSSANSRWTTVHRRQRSLAHEAVGLAHLRAAVSLEECSRVVGWRRRRRDGVVNEPKSKRKVAQPSASWLSGGLLQRLIVLQAAPRAPASLGRSALGPRWPAKVYRRRLSTPHSTMSHRAPPWS